MLDLKTLLWLVNNYRLWLIAPSMYKGPAKVFREFAQKKYTPQPEELQDAFGRFAKAVDAATVTAENLENAYRRYYAAQRARHWRPRSWKRKGW